mmetsp:Transcript_18225/g.13250  ORF Transcript_18225/g.13250 Transcript_18225/m.13250 type:complete len:189 (+) Transcript_18225:184-750(+)
MKEKEKIPSPDKYSQNQSTLTQQKISIYKHDRYSYMKDLGKKGKDVPGVGLYDCKIKDKVKGSFKSTLERVSVLEEAKLNAMLVPSHYNQPKMDLYKPKVFALKIAPVSKVEEQNKKPKKDDAPSPFSYKWEQSFDNSQLPKRSMTISKTKNVKFTELVAKSKKEVPAVGHYDISKSFDKISRPKGWK